MRRRKATVYVIGDDKSTCIPLARRLRSANFDAETFSSVDEFLNEPRSERSACIVVDIPMADVTASDLPRKLASIRLRIPIIAISNCASIIRRRADLVGTVSFFFCKPVDDRALADTLWWAIEGAPKQA